MSQEVPTSDIVFGALVLVPFLIGAYVIGRLFAAWHNRRYTAAWAPLVPLINGQVRNNTGGDVSWLDGAFKGQSVHVSMSPNSGRSRFRGDNSRYNDFSIELTGVAGQLDWQIKYPSASLLVPSEGWRVVTQDPKFEAHLQASGIIVELAKFGRPSFKFDARTQTLTYREDITPYWIPTPQRFEEILAFLLRLSASSAPQNKT
jgi:hypothetical protein